jgi:hypothetical protein
VTFVEFCERIEYTEGDTGTHHTTNNGSKTKADSKNGSTGEKSHAKSSAGGNKNKRKHNSEESFCEYHGVSGHSTGQCKVMIAQAKKMRENFETHKNNGNRVWKRSTDSKPKNESHSIEECVKSALEHYFAEKAGAAGTEQEPQENFNFEDFEEFEEQETSK